MSDKLLDIIWSLDIEKMNDHLPARKKTLKELITEKNPQTTTRGNQVHRFRKKDLEMLCELLPESEWENIKLPIVLLRRTDLEKGLFSISGGKRELYVIFKILGKTERSFAEFILDDRRPFIWKPEAFTAVKKISSVVVIGYV